MAGLITSAVLAAACLTGTPTANGAASVAVAQAAPGGTYELDSHDRRLLAAAKAEGHDHVVLIIASEEGKTGDVVARLRHLGGQVSKSVDAVGYIRARVPIGRVVEAVALPGVVAVDLNKKVKVPEPKPEPEATGSRASAIPEQGPGLDTSASNPFLPVNETGAVEFRSKNPGFDGRGVIIGIMDTGIDLDHPALQWTTTGERKIVDSVKMSDPVLDGDESWRPMVTEVAGPSFTYGGHVWTAPAGTYRINQFHESAVTFGELEGDVNRDGDSTDVFGVLYDPVSHDVRVDVNNDHHFDEGVLRPYRERYDIGHFGVDNPDTPIKERMPFTVQYREDEDATPIGLPAATDFVAINVAALGHGSHVAGIAAGNDLFGNENLDGAAPGAKIVSAQPCLGVCSTVGLAEGVVELVVNRGADVVNMSLGTGLLAVNDASDAVSQIYNNLIENAGVQLFMSAGNDGGMNTVGEPASASNVVSVAGGISKATWQSNFRSSVTKPFNLLNLSSRGPREDGGFKPNLIAPGVAISAYSTWMPGSINPQAGFTLPPGYRNMTGTSMASPQAVGGASLLLSAAKAKRVELSPAALRRALYSSARWIDGLPANGQGNGLINVPGAWNLLKHGHDVRSYTVDAPVCTPLSHLLPTPHRGVGIYNRCAVGKGGLRPDETTVRTIKLTRRSGPAQTIRHDLVWVGNDGSFRTAETLDLPLDKTIEVPVTINAGQGAHSAILRVDDPATPAVDFEVLNTVVVAQNPTGPAYAASLIGSVQRNSVDSLFVNVPEGAAALQINVSGFKSGSQVRFNAFTPEGLPIDTSTCFTNSPTPCNGAERDYANPVPGVWEIQLESVRTSDHLDNPFELTARIQGVKVEPDSVDLPDVTLGEPNPVSWQLINLYGPVTVSSAGGPLASVVEARPVIEHGAVQTYEVAVPPGANRLDVSIGKPSVAKADLDLYVFRDGDLVAVSANAGTEESVTLDNPAPGVYQVEVDAFDVPEGATTYDYRDVFAASALGFVSVQPVAVTLNNGDRLSLTGTVTAESKPANGRQLVGQMSITTVDGATIGHGKVSIGQSN
ncbi:S8 family serine peptidase [Kribbella sp. CA-253562]|uniref:S8 family serine peptidase n=1 Tax=Kribbella sp. CA-253562 TaxID=3239942 RepID=UPI003D92DEED